MDYQLLLNLGERLELLTPDQGRHDTQHNDTQHNDIQHIDK